MFTLEHYTGFCCKINIVSFWVMLVECVVIWVEFMLQRVCTMCRVMLCIYDVFCLSFVSRVTMGEFYVAVCVKFAVNLIRHTVHYSTGYPQIDRIQIISALQSVFSLTGLINSIKIKPCPSFSINFSATFGFKLLITPRSIESKLYWYYNQSWA